jgi:hypothetical protein
MVASCWLFLYDLYYDARIHEHQVPILDYPVDRGRIFLRNFGTNITV